MLNVSNLRNPRRSHPTRGGYRKLGFELMEPRIALSADFGAELTGDFAVEFRIETTDLSGQPQDSFEVGEEFLVRVLIRDANADDEIDFENLRLAGGMADLEFSENLLPVGRPEFPNPHESQLGAFFGFLSETRIDDIFAVRTKASLNSDFELLFFEVPFVALSTEGTGEVRIAADERQEALLIFEQSNLRHTEVASDALSFSVVPSDSPTDPVDREAIEAIFEPTTDQEKTLANLLGTGTGDDAENPTTKPPEKPDRIDLGSQQAVRLRIEVVDELGQVVTEFEVGGQYELRVFVQDIRDPQTLNVNSGGIFAANVDLQFSDNIAPSGSVTFGNGFRNNQTTWTPIGSRIENVGGIVSRIEPPGQQEQFLFETHFTVQSDATSAAISALPAQRNEEALLVFGLDYPVPPENIVPGNVAFPVIAQPRSVEVSETPTNSDPAPIDAPSTEPTPPSSAAGDSDASDMSSTDEAGSELTLVSFVPAAPLDGGAKQALAEQIVAPSNDRLIPDASQSLFLPWFYSPRPDDWRDASERNPPDDFSNDDDDKDDAMLDSKMEPSEASDKVGEAPSSQTTPEDEEERDSAIDEDDLAESLFFDEKIFLEGALVGPQLSAFRMQFRMYSPERKTDTNDNTNTTKPDGMIDVAEFIRRESSASPHYDHGSREQADRVAERQPIRVQDKLAGSRGSAMAFNFDVPQSFPPVQRHPDDSAHPSSD